MLHNSTKCVKKHLVSEDPWWIGCNPAYLYWKAVDKLEVRFQGYRWLAKNIRSKCTISKTRYNIKGMSIMVNHIKSVINSHLPTWANTIIWWSTTTVRVFLSWTVFTERYTCRRPNMTIYSQFSSWYKKRVLNKGFLPNMRGHLLAMNWYDRKQNRLLYSCSTPKLVEKLLYESNNKIQRVDDYNNGMDGVDISDQMTEYIIMQKYSTWLSCGDRWCFIC